VDNYLVATVLGVPKSQVRHRHTRSGHTYDPSAKDKKDFIYKMTTSEKELKKPFTGQISLMIRFTFPWPKKWYRTGKYADQLKDKHPIAHTTKPDIDNLLKFVLDSGNKILWKDDCLIRQVQMKKIYGPSPSTIITIMEKSNEE
jgi:Holliday junction resolvase RusA-like endonuclease